MKRRLIVCCDGTWQDLDQSCHTNVVKMAQAIQPLDNTNGNHIHQMIYYDEGVGTPQVNNRIIDTTLKFGGGGLGLGIDHKIQDAYRFLCLNYEPEDEIYLFGFSRGAYTVRCLAGLIYNCGLLQRKFSCEIPEAYKIYRDRLNEDKRPKGETATKFRAKYAHGVKQNGFHVPIKALCCWDTVASLGIPNLIPLLKLDEKFNEKYGFHDATINPTIEKAFHAVAIDEIYKVFDVTLMEPHSTREKEQVVQIWFPGCHGCIGGGCNEECGLSDEALLWMMKQVTKLGLALDKGNVEGGIYPNYREPFDNQAKWPFNVGGTILRDVVGEFSNLHDSVKLRWKYCPNYRPKNLMKFRDELDAWEPPEATAEATRELSPV